MSADEGGKTTPNPPTNGDTHSDAGAIATPGKRKRSAQDEKSDPDSTTSQDKVNLHDTLRNLVDLLLR